MLKKKRKTEKRYYLCVDIEGGDNAIPHDFLSAQCYELLAALRRGRVTTIQAQTELRILHPAARVAELRLAGYHIISERTVVVTPAGYAQRTVQYELVHWLDA